ncbi:MAG: glycosyltransferase family 4 protein [Candidatus Hecatellaceae archaeon]
MKILFMCKELPHAKVVGGPIIVYNRIKYLSRNHEVHLLSFYNPEDEKFLPSLEEYCSRIELVRFPPAKGLLGEVYRYLFSSVPSYMLKLYSPELKLKLNRMAEEENYDCIIAEYSFMGQYLYRNRGIPGQVVRVISVHECYTDARLKVFRVKGLSWEGLEAYLHYLQLRKYEFEMYRSADKVLTLTEEDRATLLRYAPDLKVNVVPHGVDVEYFTPEGWKPAGNVVCYLGNFGHEPNVDAVLYFYREIYPEVKREVPDVRFYVVGKAPPPEVKALEADESVVVTGYVDDVRPYLHMSKAMAVPVRLGGGFRGKTLEALASGVPLISTRLGVEGLKGREGEDYLVADSPAEFASKLTSILKDEKLAIKLSKNGRKLAEKFSWQHGVRKLEETLLKLVKDKAEGFKK